MKDNSYNQVEEKEEESKRSQEEHKFTRKRDEKYQEKQNLKEKPKIISPKKNISNSKEINNREEQELNQPKVDNRQPEPVAALKPPENVLKKSTSGFDIDAIFKGFGAF